MMNKLNMVLLVLVAISGLAVVTVQNQSRTYFNALIEAQNKEKQLDDEHSRLKLEQAKLANHKLIQQAAAVQQLALPPLEKTHMVNRKQ